MKSLSGRRPEAIAKLKDRAIDEVLRKARRMVGSISPPTRKVKLDRWEACMHSGSVELDIESSVENLSLITRDMRALVFEGRSPNDVPVGVMLDSSLSMRGEKQALLAVACAVLALTVPGEQLMILAFSSQAKLLKAFDESLDARELVRRMLEHSCAGMTNLEEALLSCLSASGSRPRANIILISDGKYTEGGDPAYLGPRFRSLHCLKLGRGQAGGALLRELSAHGKYFEAARVTELPKSLYSTVRSLLR